jgi:hypothetical protein
LMPSSSQHSTASACRWRCTGCAASPCRGHSAGGCLEDSMKCT